MDIECINENLKLIEEALIHFSEFYRTTSSSSIFFSEKIKAGNGLLALHNLQKELSKNLSGISDPVRAYN